MCKPTNNAPRCWLACCILALTCVGIGIAAQQGNFPAGGLPAGFTSVANQIQAPNGSNATPSYSFSSSTNSGLFFAAGVAIDVSGGTALFCSSGTLCLTNGTLQANTAIQGATFTTGSNCSSSAGTCGSSAAGAVSIAAAASTVTVATTAVTANSDITLTRNDALGTRLAVTCNTATAAGDIKVSTIAAGTSFVITVQNAPATNPLCLTYTIVN